MLDSLVATIEGVVDLVTGVRDQREKDEDEGNTGGIDVRHCKKIKSF
jgi:hypothetical protein